MKFHLPYFLKHRKDRMISREGGLKVIDPSGKGGWIPREGLIITQCSEGAPPLSVTLFTIIAPTVPQDVISTSKSSSHLLVRWKPPVQRNGNITYYLVLWQRLAEDGDLYINDYCHRGTPGCPRPGMLSGGWTAVLTSLFCTVATGLRLPTSSHDARFDREDPALEAEPEQGCCPCQHSPPGQAQPALETQEVTFQKKFENFLHHAITIPK